MYPASTAVLLLGFCPNQFHQKLRAQLVYRPGRKWKANLFARFLHRELRSFRREEIWRAEPEITKKQKLGNQKHILVFVKRVCFLYYLSLLFFSPESATMLVRTAFLLSVVATAALALDPSSSPTPAPTAYVPEPLDYETLTRSGGTKDGLFNYRQTYPEKRNYGPADWGKVECENINTCKGWPTNWESEYCN